MIIGKEICKSFNGFLALDHTNFHVPKGSVYGLVGPNGAGKSTLLRVVTGIFQADSGSVTINEQGVYENPKTKETLAFIPDDVFYFNTANLMDMAKYYQGLYQNFNMEQFKKMMDCFPELDSKKLIRKMSKGMQKQSAFLLAMACQPEVLILDEPVDGLDPVMRKQIWSLLLTAVSEKQMTVMVSSHNLRELEDVCDHVGIMNHGKLLIEQSLSDMQENILKVQVAFADPNTDPVLSSDSLQVLKKTSTGRVHTLIVKGPRADIVESLEAQNTLLLEFLPLSLEEIFIYELGGVNYEVKDFVF